MNSYQIAKPVQPSIKLPKNLTLLRGGDCLARCNDQVLFLSLWLVQTLEYWRVSRSRLRASRKTIAHDYCSLDVCYWRVIKADSYHFPWIKDIHKLLARRVFSNTTNCSKCIVVKSGVCYLMYGNKTHIPEMISFYVNNYVNGSLNLFSFSNWILSH